MSNVSAYGEKAMLDWVLGGATPTRPAQWAVGLSVNPPNSTSGSEIGTASGYARQNATFGAAASPAGSASNVNAMTFGPFSNISTISGAQVWDTTAVTAGNMLWFGNLATVRTIQQVGDFIVIQAGQLVITLA